MNEEVLKVFIEGARDSFITDILHLPLGGREEAAARVIFDSGIWVGFMLAQQAALMGIPPWEIGKALQTNLIRELDTTPPIPAPTDGGVH